MTRGTWLVLAALGCTGLPASTTLTAARIPVEYRIPSSAPRGDVRLASYGIALVRREHDESKSLPVRAFHVRAVVVDHADHAWVFDTRQQRVELGGYGASAPALASANPGSAPPLVTVAPFGGERIVDMFFPLPGALQRTTTRPRFDVVWMVSTDVGPISGHTPSDRVTVEPPHDRFDTAYDYGSRSYWGPPYWRNPTYPESAFGGAPAAVISEPIAIELAR